MPLFIPWANKVLELTLGRDLVAANIWVGLSTTVPGADGTNWTEVADAAYGGYSRISLAGAFGFPSGGLVGNSGPILFPIPTTGGAVVAAVGLFTDPVLGPALSGRAFRALSPAVQIIAGRQPKFDPLALTLSAA